MTTTDALERARRPRPRRWARAAIGLAAGRSDVAVVRRSGRRAGVMRRSGVAKCGRTRDTRTSGWCSSWLWASRRPRHGARAGSRSHGEDGGGSGCRSRSAPCKVVVVVKVRRAGRVIGRQRALVWVYSKQIGGDVSGRYQSAKSNVKAGENAVWKRRQRLHSGGEG
jgi:hypothetical protein